MSNNSSLSMVESKLPPGFRFHPRDEELICDYLMKKVDQSTDQQQYPLLIEVDLNKSEPWEIPEVACVGGKEWYFYSQRDRKYATGLRTNRATVSGYWKATGKDRAIIRKGSLVGMRKTLVFYQGRAPKGRKSDWVMHEFRLDEGPLSNIRPQISSLKEDWVLCRVFHKNKELLATKQGFGSNNIYYDNDTISSSSLPPLMDPYITFDQINPNNNINMNELYYEQVPCFSIFTPNQTFTSSHSHHLPATTTAIGSTPITTAYGGFPADIGNYLNATATSSTCDNKVIKAVLSHLSTKNNIMEGNSNNNIINPAQNIVNIKGGNSPSFGEGSSETSFLSEVGYPTIWNNY